MKKMLNLAGSFLIGLLMLFTLWCIYILFSVYSLQPVSTSGYAVPKNAELVVRLDGKDVAKNTLLAILLEGKGERLLEKIKSLPETDSPSQYGINWIEPIIYFTAKHNGKPLQGLIVQIASTYEWDNEIDELFGETSAFKREKFSGIVVQSNELSKQELDAFLASQTTKTIQRENKLIAVSQKSDKGNAEFFIDAKDNEILLKGMVNHDGSAQSNQLNYILTPSDFHFTSDIISKELNDTLSKLLGTSLNITAISMNYRDVSIDLSSFIPTPDLDVILAFENPTSIAQIVELIPNVKWKETNKTFAIGRRTYFVKQLDEKTIFIGRNENAEIKANTHSLGVIAKGKLKLNKMISMAMRMHPEVSMLIKLTEEVEYFNFRFEPVSKTSYQLTGVVAFKKDQNAIVKLLETFI